MRTLTYYLLTLALLVSCASVCLAQGNKDSDGPPAPAAEYNANAWKEFASPEGRFSVRMVGTPQASTHEVAFAAGKVTAHMFVSETGTGAYVVMYADFAHYSEDPSIIKQALDGARDDLLAANQKRKLLKENELNVEGHVGRELFIAEEGVLLRYRIFFVRERLYQVALGTPMNVAFSRGYPNKKVDDWTDLYESMVQRFFGSFKLVPVPIPSGGAVLANPMIGDQAAGVVGAEPEPAARVSMGVLNGKAINKPVPVYPLEARNVQGEVRVKVVIDESGKVIWAQAVSGPEPLRAAAVAAARRTTFLPTTVQGKAEKVMGFLTYKFTH